MKPEIDPFLQQVAEACHNKFCVRGKNRDGIKGYLTNLRDESRRLTAEEIDAANTVEGFIGLFSKLEKKHLIDLNNGENLKMIKPKNLRLDSDVLDPATTQRSLRECAENFNLDGVFLVSDRKRTYAFEHGHEGHLKSPFAIHSIGKVFTGVLIARMIEDGDISHEQLAAPIELDEETRKLLPEKVREHLPKVTLHQTMTHRAGFTDYVGNYIDRLATGEALNPKDPKDFLQLAKDSVCDFTPGEKEHYSNTGILLTGLSALHLYNKGRPLEQQKTYQELLEEKILRPAGITNFSVTKPEGAMFDERDLVADKINGSPAGGYWVTAGDMQKFGKWLCQKWKEEGFREVTREFGQEFFDAKSQTIQHAGGIGGTPKNPGEEVPGSTTWFSVNPQSELVVVAGSKTHGGATFGIGTTAAINLELDRQAERAEANFKDLVAQGKKSKEAEGAIGNKKPWADKMKTSRDDFNLPGH